jgi:transposase-like protein
MSGTQRKFDQDFREDAVRRVRETGKRIAEVARDLNMSAGTLGSWVRADRRARDNGAGGLGEVPDGSATGTPPAHGLLSAGHTVADDEQDGQDQPSQRAPALVQESRPGSSESTTPRVPDRHPAVTAAVSPDAAPQRPRLMTLGLSALFAASLVLIAVGYLLDIGAIRLVGVLGAVFFGVGTAPLQLSERPSLPMRLGVAGVVGLSVLALVASAMVLVPVWQPWPAAAVIGAAAAGVHVEACRRVLTGLRGSGVFRSWRTGWWAGVDASIACTIIGTVLWWGAALGLGHVVPGVGGFLPDISPLWYVGLVLLLAAIVLARGKSEARAMVALVSLVAALTLTPALAYGTPRNQSAAKHVYLVQLILHAHHLNPGAGIFQAYSGFFSAVAWVCTLAHIHASMGLAAYWPFVIGLVGLAELRFFFGQLISSSYRIAVGMTAVVLVNAIGADYFSPQSVGFALGLGIYGLAVGRSWPGLSDRMRITLLVVAGCSLALTHELSPYIVGGVLVVLVIFRAARPWYVPATCLVPAILWGLLNKHVLASFVYLTLFGNLSNFTPPKTVATPGLHRLGIVGDSSHALLFGLLALIALAGAGFVYTLRRLPTRRLPTWGFGISAGVGLLIISVNPYGNEGIFRAALFGIPWLAVIAVVAIPSNPPPWMSALLGAVAVGLLGTFLVSSFGLDNADVIRPADVQAFQVYEAQAPASSYFLNLSYGDVPGSVTFPQGGNGLQWTDVVPRASLVAGRPNAADVAAVARSFINYAAKHGGATRDLYALWSPASAQYSVDYGLETLAHSQRWRSLLIASPHWRVVFHRDGTYLFRVVVPSRASTSRHG